MAINQTEEDRKREAAEAEARANGDTYTHVFAKPFEYEGKTYTELHFNFASLIGRDSLAIEAELATQGRTVLMPEISGPYKVRFAARACEEKIGSDVIEAMPIKDFNRITGAVRSFLTRSE